MGTLFKMKSEFSYLCILLVLISMGETRYLFDDLVSGGDPCYEKYHDETSCNGDNTTGGGCVWCKCAALPSACFTKADASRLPPNIYQCAKKSPFIFEQWDNVIIEIIH